MGISPLIDRLIEAFQVLPGVGPKGAQRMALYLLQHNRSGGRALAATLQEAMDQVGQCGHCRTLCETDVCRLCSDVRRNDEQLCIVESPADILAIDQAGGYRGRFFVLHGHLSPLDGVGPDELGMGLLKERVRALKPREATAHYISDMLKVDVAEITRIAHGVPLGGELEYIDGGTIVHALQGRRSVS